MRVPFFNELEKAGNILIAGAGGGFDVFCGLPLFFWLRNAGKKVHLANLSSGALGFCDAENPSPALWRSTQKTAATKYFPEMHLARWLADRYGETPVFAIEPSGARRVRQAYDWLAQTLRPDEFRLYRDACEFTFARLPHQPSIVNTSIIAAVAGSFGDIHPTERTEGSSLFINPMMGLYGCFHVEGVVRRNLYLDQIRNTDTAGEVALIIERFRESLPKIRPWATIPC